MYYDSNQHESNNNYDDEVISTKYSLLNIRVYIYIYLYTYINSAHLINGLG